MISIVVIAVIFKKVNFFESDYDFIIVSELCKNKLIIQLKSFNIKMLKFKNQIILINIAISANVKNLHTFFYLSKEIKNHLRCKDYTFWFAKIYLHSASSPK